MKIAEMTTKDLEYYINLVNEAVEGLRRLTSILKEVLQWVKCYPTALKAIETLCMEGRVNQCKTLDCSYFKKLPWPLRPSVTLP